MSTNVTQFNNMGLPPAPAKSQARIASGHGIAKRFTAGIAAPFPVMSIAGKEFRLKSDGLEHSFGLGQPVEVVLVNSSPVTNKSFYLKGYDGKSNDAPDCWSADGVKPDLSVAVKQSPTCAGCPHNAFGSAKRVERGPTGQLVETQGKGKACADVRKLVLMMENDLLSNSLGPVLMRLPVTSHKNLKAYVEYIARAGYEPNACVTRMEFVSQNPKGPGTLSYPLLQFTFHRGLSDDEYEAALHFETDERTERIMASPPVPEGEDPSVQNANAPLPHYQQAQAPVYQPQTGQQATQSWAPPQQAAPAPTQPAPMQQVATPPAAQHTPPEAWALPEGWRRLGNGKFFNIATKQQFDAIPEPEPKRNLEDLGDGTSLDLDTGEVIANEDYKPPASVVIAPLKPDGDGAKAKAPADVQEANQEAPTQTWTPPATPSYDPGDPSAQGATPPPPARTRKRAVATPMQTMEAQEAKREHVAEAKAKTEAAQQQTAPAANGSAQPASKALENILSALGKKTTPGAPTPQS